MKVGTFIGHILHKNCLLKEVIEGKIEGRIEVGLEDEEEEVNSYWRTLRKRKISEIERGSASSCSVENSFWMTLWTRRKADYELKNKIVIPVCIPLPKYILCNAYFFIYATAQCFTCLG